MPCLLLKQNSLVKTIKFKNPGYIGDAINTVKIFNEYEVDELIFLDIDASPENKKPNFDIIKEIASECFMPLTYGGGIRNLEDIETIFKIGVEKIAINTYSFENMSFIFEASKRFGSQSIIASIDAKKNIWQKYEVVSCNGKKKTGHDPVEWAKKMEETGAGEILLTSVERDGTWEGYDLDLIRRVSQIVTIPVIANGGAGSLEDIRNAVKTAGASAVAIGSMVVYQKKDLGVLVNFPSKKELIKTLE
jgi:imidazole glycerol-phosphate synthase subunit HisF